MDECTCDGRDSWDIDCDVHVGCDERCGALKSPPKDNPAEVWKSFIHYRDHRYLAGCSHGN